MALLLIIDNFEYNRCRNYTSILRRQSHRQPVVQTRKQAHVHTQTFKPTNAQAYIHATPARSHICTQKNMHTHMRAHTRNMSVCKLGNVTKIPQHIF
jgi:hypothetical protein